MKLASWVVLITIALSVQYAPFSAKVSTRCSTIVAVTGDEPSYVTFYETPAANNSPFVDSPLWSFPVYGAGQPLIGSACIYYYPDYGHLIDSSGAEFVFAYT